jgi:uncharacterized protein YehS (DUF1456 family)
MTNNDILRSLRYARDFSDAELIHFFAEASVVMSRERLLALLEREDEPGYEPLSDELFGRFLDGLVDAHRGKREPSGTASPPPAQPMTNNRVLRALRIAFELKDVDIVAILELAGFTISKSELNALFRREGHPNFQECGNQFLRNFLRGLGLARRAARPGKP